MTIQRQIKLRPSPRQERELNHWLIHLTAVWNWAIKRVERNAEIGTGSPLNTPEGDGNMPTQTEPEAQPQGGELLRCRFCLEGIGEVRQTHEYIPEVSRRLYAAVCDNCGARGPEECSEAEAAAIWNSAACADLPRATVDSFQARVHPWLQKCFGSQIAADTLERNHRFLEESLDLVQSLGCTQAEAHQLVDYVFNRESGDPAQEVGGVMVTLAALCLANNLDMHIAAESELARIWTKVETIRAKQAAKPPHSPLPAGRATRETTVEAALAELREIVPDATFLSVKEHAIYQPSMGHQPVQADIQIEDRGFRRASLADCMAQVRAAAQTKAERGRGVDE